MKARELIRLLKDTLREHAVDDMEVRIATQMRWPTSHDVYAVNMAKHNMNGADVSVLWIAASESVSNAESPYAPHAAWDGDE